ncbi:toxin-antitoxin system YwqK family antitoxin [Mucilaginibacter lacusdianchii]|uniref:toxin-antitoxin system YwqK family antitoxin n=1 Tax=Mucilaginibacter lacusdianchii TaxID=2684211 RepID=UPI00131CCD01|nr:hypothetical protein [Mucilaginibacter sp. JXJ CY 39]
MKKLTYLLLLASTTTVQAQHIPTLGVNKVRITAPGKTIVAELSTKDESEPQTDRSYYWYGSNAVHITQGGYSGKLLHGSYQEFYPDKSLREQGEFKKGLKEGTWKTWQESGALEELTTWHYGQKEGDFVLYDAAGKPQKTGHYENGLLEGKVLIYHGGDSIETVKYKNGLVVSNKLASPSLWQKVKAIKWKRKVSPPENSVPPATAPAKPKKVKKQKDKDTVPNAG